MKNMKKKKSYILKLVKNVYIFKLDNRKINLKSLNKYIKISY